MDSKDSHEIAIFIKTLKSTLSAQEIIKKQTNFITVLTSKFDHQLEELKALHLKELADRDGKIKVMKMQMADALKDNSR